MGNFKFSYSDAEKIIRHNSFQDSIDSIGVFFIGIRGAIPKDNTCWKNLKNSVELTSKPIDYLHYNCTIIQVKDKNLSAFRATTLPGKPYVDSPVNPNGAARLLQGRHIFRQGYHNSDNVEKRYPALRQNAAFPLLRDTNKNLQFDWETDILSFTKTSGINIHYGKGDLIGRWSAGCQVVNTDSGLEKWNTFKNRIYSGAPDISKNHIYYLFDADYVENYCKTSESDKWKRMRFLWGSEGEYVKQLQTEFLELGYDVGEADSDFGRNTMLNGVMQYQRVNFENGKYDGVVDIELWKHIFSDNALPNDL